MLWEVSTLCNTLKIEIASMKIYDIRFFLAGLQNIKNAVNYYAKYVFVNIVTVDNNSFHLPHKMLIYAHVYLPHKNSGRNLQARVSRECANVSLMILDGCRWYLAKLLPAYMKVVTWITWYVLLLPNFYDKFLNSHLIGGFNEKLDN